MKTNFSPQAAVAIMSAINAADQFGSGLHSTHHLGLAGPPAAASSLNGAVDNAS